MSDCTSLQHIPPNGVHTYSDDAQWFRMEFTSDGVKVIQEDAEAFCKSTCSHGEHHGWCRFADPEQQ